LRLFVKGLWFNEQQIVAVFLYSEIMKRLKPETNFNKNHTQGLRTIVVLSFLIICYPLFSQIKKTPAAEEVSSEYFIEYIDISSRLSNNYVSKIEKDEFGMIWIGTYNGLYNFNPVDSTFLRKDNLRPGKFPSAIVLSLLPVDTAANGFEGKERAFETIPDLIISDVMMPEIDGIELCAFIKNDIRTSHIPIILLTARTSTVYEVDGLEMGADDYVRKPFDSQVIKSRVASQLGNRKKVRSHLVNQIRFEPNNVIKPVNREEEFIHKLSEIVENSINEEEFTIDTLADDLCMSQSTLYRKIKSLTGMSIVGFIRSIRLKKSTEILLTEDIKLSAVAYAVGFNDYKYFKKSFTQQYGVSPKEYRENAINEAS